MEPTGKETELQRDLINAAKAATMLFMYVCRELDSDHESSEPDFSKKHPEAVAACMNAAALLHMAGVKPEDFKRRRQG